MHYIRSYQITPCDQVLWTFLEQHHVKCFGLPKGVAPGECNLLFFHIDESMDGFCEIEPHLPEATPDLAVKEIISSRKLDRHVTIRYYPQYTEEDCQIASWLQIRATSLKVMPANDETLYKKVCTHGESKTGVVLSHHSVLSQPIVVAKEVKWGNLQFFSGIYFGEEICCNSKTRTMLESSELRGIRFDPILKGREKEPLTTTFHVRSQHRIPNDAFFPVQDVIESRCSQCGIQLLHISGERPLYGIRPQFLHTEVDFYETLPSFGGPPGTSCGVKYVVSQRMYSFLKKQRMTRAVEFIPFLE